MGPSNRSYLSNIKPFSTSMIMGERVGSVKPFSVSVSQDPLGECNPMICVHLKLSWGCPKMFFYTSLQDLKKTHELRVTYPSDERFFFCELPGTSYYLNDVNTRLQSAGILEHLRRYISWIYKRNV